MVGFRGVAEHAQIVGRVCLEGLLCVCAWIRSGSDPACRTALSILLHVEVAFAFAVAFLSCGGQSCATHDPKK